MTPRLFLPHLAVAVMALVAAAGCGDRATQSNSAPSGSLQEPPVGARVASVNESAEGRRAALLNRIRAADPKKETIERALLNDRNDLGLILSRKTELDEVPKLLKAMIVQMDQAFPGEDHVAVAYAPTNPPKTIGTARSDARTRDITYQPASTP